VTTCPTIRDPLRGIAPVQATPTTPSPEPENSGRLLKPLLTDLTYLRIMRNDGLAITGDVLLNRVMEVEDNATGAATLSRLQAGDQVGGTRSPMGLRRRHAQRSWPS
jgi:hypothetical protein